jgi:hypothetical protein
MMLLLTPPWMLPMVTMAGAVVTLSCRLGMVWRASTISEATTIGSTPNQGMAAWVCLPRTRISSVSELAMVPPER